MKLTAQVKLLPTAEQGQALQQTMRQANAACDFVSARAWAEGIFGQWSLHHACYHTIREQFGLSAQVAVRAISKVADAYKLNRKTKRTFRPTGAISYDRRILRWYVDESELSIWTVAGRQRIPFVCGERQRRLLEGQHGETDLAFRDGAFYLLATCNVEQPESSDVTDFLGVDLGIVNIATDSDGNGYSGGQVNGLRHRHRRLRQRLQKKRTKSAHRLLKQRRRKEARFAADINHCISKSIVATAQDTGRGIALEELSGIRDRVTARKPQRATLHSWAFAQLRFFIAYKAALAGVVVRAVDPRNTSRICPACGLIDKRNRKNQASFLCVRCGFSAPADLNAAENIRRVAVNLPNAAGLLA